LGIIRKNRCVTEIKRKFINGSVESTQLLQATKR
jgi:hypothetical protein